MTSMTLIVLLAASTVALICWALYIPSDHELNSRKIPYPFPPDLPDNPPETGQDVQS